MPPAACAAADQAPAEDAKLEKQPVPSQQAPAVAAKSGRRANDGPVETPEELEGRFDYQSKLGEGTYGVVYKAIEAATGATVAVKEIKIDHCDDGIPSTAIREIAVL